MKKAPKSQTSPPAERNILSVTDLTRQIKAILTNRFPVVWVEGEISNFNVSHAGHFYFSLKDELSQIRVVMFRGNNRKIKFELKDGLNVVIRGSVDVYEKNGNYQLHAENIEPKGIGALQLAFEQLKEKLAKEGLFEQARKRPIPMLPQRIGIVTSPTGAAIRDILNIIDRRFANVEVLLYPARVQGEGAAQEIAEGIKELNNFNLDVLIVGRGGGSMEDLWAFNEEIVARAIYRSKIPIISAVGHEIDFTIADFVADLRAPTPSAAAELVVCNKIELGNQIEHFYIRLREAFQHELESLNARIEHCMAKLRDPMAMIREYKQRIDNFMEWLHKGILHRVEAVRNKMEALIQQLEILSPLAILGRGYSITKKGATNEIIKDASSVKPGEMVNVKVHKGDMLCSVESTSKD